MESRSCAFCNVTVFAKFNGRLSSMCDECFKTKEKPRRIPFDKNPPVCRKGACQNKAYLTRKNRWSTECKDCESLVIHTSKERSDPEITKDPPNCMVKECQNKVSLTKNKKWPTSCIECMIKSHTFVSSTEP